VIILVILLLYPLVVAGAVLVLNDKCLIPGTTNYKCRQLERKTQLDTERSRAAVIQARNLATENGFLDNQMLQLTTGSKNE